MRPLQLDFDAVELVSPGQVVDLSLPTMLVILCSDLLVGVDTIIRKGVVTLHGGLLDQGLSLFRLFGDHGHCQSQGLLIG